MDNAYEIAAQKIIPAVLLYAFYQGQVLMIHSKKWNGLGGKLEKGESPLDAAVREFHEESDCETHRNQWTWLGQLYFPNFKASKNEDWWVSVFITELTEVQFKKIPVNDSTRKEGLLDWVKNSEVFSRDLWNGDPFFLPFVFEEKPFQGTFYYENGNCVRHEISEIMRPHGSLN